MAMQKLPFKNIEIENISLLRFAAQVQGDLGQVNGLAKSIPNQDILLSLLPIQEAQFSSEIENIVTTSDDLYKAQITKKKYSPNIKEVQNYVQALRKGFDIVKKDKLLSNRTICKIQETLTGNNAGFRTQAGTHLKNDSGEIVYTPPQNGKEITNLMKNLEVFINDNSISKMNPLIKMALIHHQFESIHPFYDGNGRTGRIINILYLHLQGLSDLPILYLSGYIIENKDNYYKLLQNTREKNTWEQWIHFMLMGIGITALETVFLINQIYALMLEFKTTIRKQYAKIYSQDLINTLFKYPYTKIDFVSKELMLTRQTASRYLHNLYKIGLLEKTIVGRDSYFINKKLIHTFINAKKKFYDPMQKNSAN